MKLRHQSKKSIARRMTDNIAKPMQVLLSDLAAIVTSMAPLHSAQWFPMQRSIIGYRHFGGKSKQELSCHFDIDKQVREPACRLCKTLNDPCKDIHCGQASILPAHLVNSTISDVDA